jgi:hypothetical protein
MARHWVVGLQIKAKLLLAGLWFRLNTSMSNFESLLEKRARGCGIMAGKATEKQHSYIVHEGRHCLFVSARVLFPLLKQSSALP